MNFINLQSYRKFLSKHKVYTFTNVVGLSISLMFIILLGLYIQQELSVDDFHEKKDRIYLLTTINDNGRISSGIANPTTDYVKDLLPEVESFTRIVERDLNIKTSEQLSAIKLKALFVDTSFFNIFSFKLAEGNPSTVLNAKYTAVITTNCARRIFGNINPIGKTIDVSGKQVSITGLMHEFPNNSQIAACDIVLNYQMIDLFWGDEILSNLGHVSFTAYFLAKEGQNLKAKESILLEGFKKDFWIFKYNFCTDIAFVPLRDVYFSNIHGANIKLQTNSKKTISILLGIAGLILLVSLLNYINLSVSQVSFRGKEAAIKKLIGSTRRSLIIQLMGESVLLTFGAFGLGLILALVAQPVFNDLLQTKLNILSQLHWDTGCLFLLCVLFIGCIAGLVPAWVISQFEPIEVVKGDFTRKLKTSYSKVLITFQYTVAIALLICSLFVVLQTRFMQHHNLGFNKDHILILDNNVKPEEMEGFRSKLQTIPGVQRVSFSSGTPLDGGNNFSFTYNNEALSFQIFEVDSVFFDIFGIEVESTGMQTSQDACIVNTKAYKVLQPDTVSYTFMIPGDRKMQITGITKDFNFRSLHQPIGLALIQINNNNLTPWSIVVQLSPAANLLQTVQSIKDVYIQYGVQDEIEIAFSDDLVQAWYQQEVRLTQIIAAFTLLTIIILIMGIFAMSLYFIKQKEKEIAIRKINGSTVTQIVAMLNRLFLSSILTAYCFAVPLSYFAISQWLQGFPYKTPLDWWVFAVSGIAVWFLSLATMSWQSYKAATAQPTETLKSS